MGDDPCPFVNNVPVLTGGMGQKELHEFYKDFFIPGNPPSFNMKLVSRTIGVDKVVDEVFVTFDHTQEMPWILPSVPATNKVDFDGFIEQQTADSDLLARGDSFSVDRIVQRWQTVS